MSKLRIRWKKCEHDDRKSFNKLRVGQRCASCSPTKTKSLTDLRRLGRARKFKILTSRYINSQSRIKILWLGCKHTVYKRVTRLFTGEGCARCNDYRNESLGELAITKRLARNVSPDFSKYRRFLGALDLDAYSPSLHIGVEFNGKQHYQPVDWFGGKPSFKRQQERDGRRRRLCKARGIHLIEIHHKDYDRDPEGTIKKLIEEIREVNKSRTPNLLETAAWAS